MDPLERISTGFIEAKILLTAAELRVFEALAGEGATAEIVGRKIRGQRRAVEILLDALVAMELLDKRDGVYRLLPELAGKLADASGSQFPSLLRHRNRMFRNWAWLEERVRGEDPPVSGDSLLEDPKSNEDFIRAMWEVGHETSREVTAHVDLEGVRTLADVGGGPGHHLEAFAVRAPALEPYLVDLPLTLSVARRVLATSSVRDRIRMVAWNVYEDPPPAGLPPFDVVFVSQLIHGEPPGRNRAFFRRLHPIVSPGGRVIVHDKVVNPDRTQPAHAALFAINMLAMTEGGRTYTEYEILSWGREAGFTPEPGIRVDERSYLVRMVR